MWYPPFANVTVKPLAGALSVTLLQLPTGEAWTGVTGTTSYDNRNLVLRDVVLNEQTRFSLINADASRIREHMMTLRLVGTLDGAPIDLQASLAEQARSLFIKSHTTARNLSLSSAKKLGLFSDAPVQGNVENFTFDFVGLLRAPKTWAASGAGVVRDLQVAGATFDRAAAQISAHDGVATIQPVELTRAGTALQIHGTVQLPEHADDLGDLPRRALDLAHRRRFGGIFRSTIEAEDRLIHLRTKTGSPESLLHLGRFGRKKYFHGRVLKKAIDSRQFIRTLCGPAR